jgi:hypothetical protein
LTERPLANVKEIGLASSNDVDHSQYPNDGLGGSLLRYKTAYEQALGLHEARRNP